MVSGVRDARAQSRQAGRSGTEALAELHVPALVLHGDADPLLRPAAARRTAAAIDGARLVILPGVGHDLPQAVWPVVADEVRALADRARPGEPDRAGQEEVAPARPLARPGSPPERPDSSAAPGEHIR